MSLGKHCLWIAALAHTAAIAFAQPAYATLIDFEDLASPNDLAGAGPAYSSAGYTFLYTPAPGEPFPVGFFAAGPSWPFNTGSTALYANSVDAITTLQRDDSQPFSLIAIDLAEVNGPGDARVLFDGIKAGGQHVQQLFVLDGLTGFEHFTFSGDFSGLSVVRWQQGNNISPNNLHMFDNVSLSSVTAVPEPETCALMLAGMGLLGYRFRRGK